MATRKSKPGTRALPGITITELLAISDRLHRAEALVYCVQQVFDERVSEAGERREVGHTVDSAIAVTLHVVIEMLRHEQKSIGSIRLSKRVQAP